MDRNNCYVALAAYNALKVVWTVLKTTLKDKSAQMENGAVLHAE